MILTSQIGRIMDRLRQRKRAYQLCFGSPAGEAVLTDLVKFCRGAQSCFDDDPRIHAAFEGRREVLLRIQQMLNLSSEHLFKLYYRTAQDSAQGEDNG